MNSPTILITDDEPHMRRLIKFALKSMGGAIEEASSGEETVTRLGREPVDLLLIDYQLQGINGLDTIAAVRQLDHGAELPVILLTARGDTGIKDAAQSAGVNAFLTKPFSPIELRELVQKLLAA